MGIKFPIKEDFFNKWSQDMAYILGYLYADGNLTYSEKMRGKYVSITSIDIDRLEYVKDQLKSQHKLVVYKNNKYTPKYLFRVGSTRLYDRLNFLGLSPNKSLTMTFPTVPEKYLASFILGYLDGDGCVFLEKHTTNKIEKLKRLRIIFTSGSKLYLEQLKSILTKTMGVNGKLYGKKNINRLIYNTKESVSLFPFLYSNHKNYMKRKFDQFQKYFRLRPEQINTKIRKILERA